MSNKNTNNKLPEGIKSIKEAYFTGGSAMDPYMANNGGTSRDNYGYKYSARCFDHSLEMKSNNSQGGYTTLGKGSEVSGYPLNGEKDKRITGHIFVIRRDPYGFITDVIILHNGTQIKLDIDSIIAVPKFAEKEYLTNLPVTESVKRIKIANKLIKDGHKAFVFEGNTYVSTVSNGKPLIVKLNKKGNAVKIVSLFEEQNQDLLNTLYETINR